MIQYIKLKLAQRKKKREAVRLLDAEKLLNKYGISCVRITTKAGTDYIQWKDGSLRKIGRAGG